MSKKTQQLADELTREITSDIQPVMVNGFEMANIAIGAMLRTTMLAAPFARNRSEMKLMNEVAIMACINMLVMAGLYTDDKMYQVVSKMYDTLEFPKRPAHGADTGNEELDRLVNKGFGLEA